METLNAMTQKQVWSIASSEFHIVGMSKARKDDLVLAVFNHPDNALGDAGVINYSVAELNKKTQKQLWAIAKDTFKIVGMSKARTDDLVNAIVNANNAKSSDTPKPKSEVKAKTGGKITVQCDSNRFPVDMAGKTVKEIVAATRVEANIHNNATYRINGKIVGISDIVKEGQTLNVINPVDSKGVM